jgi:leucyl/phenylalanyl-tRNA--protein transferase
VTDWNARPEPVGAPHWSFPPPSDWPAGDAIAIGGDLDPATVIGAYRRGIFPMVLEKSNPVLVWWSPDPRGILPIDKLRVTESLKRSARRFDVRVDTRFADVIAACAEPSRPRGWITPEFIDAYTQLHALGWAHSIEAFDRDGALAGGLYGVRVGGLFAGESMFHRQRDASKVALMALVDLMRQSGMALLDVQWTSSHLESLGAVAVPRTTYLELLADAVGASPHAG